MDSHILSQVALAALAPLQFGYHMAELNAPLPFMGCQGVEAPDNLDCIPGLGKGALPSSIYALGGLVGSSGAGIISDKTGFKLALVISCILFTTGSVIEWLSLTVTQLTTGRLLTGIGAGTAIVVTPMLIGQISPPTKRGMLGSTTQISVNIGILLTQLAGVWWAVDAWRQVIALGVAIAVVALVAQAFKLEEPQSYSPDSVMEIEDTILPAPIIQGSVSMCRYLTHRRYRKSLASAVGIMALQQFTGVNAIIFYGVAVLQETLPQLSREINLGISAINLIVTIASAFLIDHFGAKRLLTASFIGMSFSTAALAFALVRGMGGLAGTAATATIAAFAVGVGPIPFHLIGDLTPSEALSSAQSVGTTVNWLATFVVGAAFPAAKTAMGPSVFYLFALFSALGSVAVFVGL